MAGEVVAPLCGSCIGVIVGIGQLLVVIVISDVDEPSKRVVGVLDAHGPVDQSLMRVSRPVPSYALRMTGASGSSCGVI